MKVMHLPIGLKSRFAFVIVIFIVITMVTQGAHRMSDARERIAHELPRGPSPRGCGTPRGAVVVELCMVGEVRAMAVARRPR